MVRKTARTSATRRQRRVRLEVEGLEQRVVPVVPLPRTHVWDGGAADNLFSSAANWSDDVVPKAGDETVFDGTSTKMAIVDAAFAGTVAKMEIDAAFASTIELQRDLTVTDKLSQTGATLDGAADLLLPAGSVCNWFGGTWSGTGSVATAYGGYLNIAGQGSEPLTLVGRTIDNQGTATWTQGDIAATGGVFENGTGATFAISGDVNWTDSSVTSVWTNAGTITNTAAGTVTIAATLNSSGSVAAASGSLQLGAGGTLSGSLSAADSAELVFAGGNFALQDQTAVTGPGWARVGNDAAIAFSGAVSAENLAVDPQGAVDGTGALTVNNQMNNGGAVGGAGTLEINGPINNNGGTVGGTGNLTVTGTVTNTSGTVGGSGIVTVNGTLTNNGTVGAAGTVAVNGTLNTRGIIDGTGTVVVNGTLNWTFGTMQGTGTTRLSGGVMNIGCDENDNLWLENRTLQNQGTINWIGTSPDTVWMMRGTARITNEGIFNISPAANRVVWLNGDGTFRNASGGVIRQTVARPAVLRGITFENHGSVEVNAGELYLWDVTGVSTGIFQTQAGTSVILEPSENGTQTNITLDPNLDDADQHMLRGDGWFIVREGGSLTVAEFNVVEADNLALETGGTLTGLGTLAIHNCRWDGGTMDSPEVEGGGGPGVTEVAAGGIMSIPGPENHTLNRRQLLNRGTVVWGSAGDLAGDILVQNGGSVVNDGTNNGGRFDVWNDRTIVNVELQAGKFIVQNNGVFQKHLTEYLGTTTIQLVFENNGGTVNADGSVTFTQGLSQTLANSVTNLGLGTYQFPDVFINISAGTLQLSGGSVTARRIVLQSNAAFQGNGEVDAPLWNVGGTVSLQGNLTLSRFFWQQGNLRVNGQTLTMNGHNLLNDNGTIELNGGTLIQGGGSELQNRGLLVGPGTINGRVQNRGTIRVGSGASDVLAINAPAMRNFAGATISLNGGTLTHTGATAILNEGRILGPGRLNVTLPVENAAGGVIQVGGGAQAGVLVVDGGLQLDAGSLLSVEIGGTAAGTDYSQLVVTGHLTLGGTLAVVLLNGFLPDPETPDTFQVVTFDSVEGAFANDDQTVDLGNGLFLDIDYDLTDVTLVTRG